MVKEKVNTKEANQIYLWLNILHVAFLTYYVIRVLRLVDIFRVDNIEKWGILIAFIVISNLLAVYAKRKGGIMNPIKSNQLAKILQRAAIITFLAGVLLPLVLQYNYNLRYIALLSIPLMIGATYYGFKDIITGDDNEVIDDFDFNDDA